MTEAQLQDIAREYRVPYELVAMVKQNKKIPVPNFAAGGVATPADAALLRQLGAETVFVGSGIFKSEDPKKLARAVVEATCHFNDPKKLLAVSRGLGKAMFGLEMRTIPEDQQLAKRGW